MEKTIEISEYELTHGKPIPSKLHSKIQSKLIAQIDHDYGDMVDIFSELSLLLDSWKSVPDIALYKKDRLDYNEDEIEVTIAPLLTIEILSPSQSINEMYHKVRQYFEHGVISCWIVLPVFKNIYVFSDKTQYEIFREDEVLMNTVMDVKIPLANIF